MNLAQFYLTIEFFSLILFYDKKSIYDLYINCIVKWSIGYHKLFQNQSFEYTIFLIYNSLGMKAFLNMLCIYLYI